MFEMKPEYYIGIKMIDEQHKQLFKYADEAYELLNDEFTPDKYDRVDILLEKLYDYTVKHLADEEAYMESIHYNKLFTQKVQHQAFIEKLDEFMESHNKEEENQDEQIMKILIFKTVFLQSQTKRSETNCLNGMQTSWEVIWIHRAKEEFESEEGKEAFEISWN